MRQARYPIAQGSRGRGTLDLVFDGVTPLDSRITFTRASTGTYVNSAGVIATAAQNEMRVDFDPVTLACKGLLIEEARTNLLLRSAEFDNASWTKSAATVTANATTAPDGTLTADKLVEDIAAGVPHNAQQTTTNGNSAYVMSVYVKASERTLVFVGMSDGVTALSGAFFNLSTQVVTQSTGGSWTATNAFMQSVGNGWFRCVAIGTRGAGTTTIAQIYLATSTASVSYTGDGTSGLFIWGAQLEAGAFATSYIPTVASQVTRSADVAVMTRGNFSTWYNPAAGTFVCEFEGNKSGVYINARDATTINRLPNLSIGSALAYEGYVVSGGAVTSTLAPSGTHVPGTFAKLAYAYASADYAATVNGSAVVTSAGAIATGMDRLQIGSYDGTSSFLNGHIKRLTYYPTRLTNAQLQGLST